MSDPIEELNRLGDALEGAPMPLPASAIRARGDRIRRRKHALVAGASAAVVAAVAVPVVAFTVNGSDDKAEFTPSPSPSVSDPVPAAALSEENLLTSDDAIYPNDGGDWSAAETLPNEGSDFSPCAQGSLSELGAESAFQRRFEFVFAGEVDPSNTFNEVIAEFPSDADAQAAYDEIKGWLGDCLPEGADTYDAGDFSAVPIGVDGAAESHYSTYGPVPESEDPSGDNSFQLETGLVVSGDRIAVLSQLTIGQDYIWEDGTPIEQMLPVAAERLALGNGGQAGSGWPTEIPDDFPLAAGWPEDDGSDEFQYDEPSDDTESMEAAGDLTSCDQPVDYGESMDQLTTRITWGSEYYARELRLFSDPDEADAFVDSIQDAFMVCEVEGDAPYTVDGITQGEPGSPSYLTIQAAEGVHRTVIYVVWLGNAVAVAIQSDEGGPDTGTGGGLLTEVGENLETVVEEMILLQGSDAPSTIVPDIGDPAPTTTIPDDLPIDVDMADMGSDGEFHTPYRPDGSEVGLGVDLCGQRVWPVADTVDQLWAWADGPEYGDRRELVTFPTVSGAIATIGSIRTALADCTEDGDSVWTEHPSDTGYEDSVTFSLTYTNSLGLNTYQVTRVGNAVLFTMIYGEGSLDSAPENAESRNELVRNIAPSLCVFTVDGC